jgi:hypothetical protein
MNYLYKHGLPFGEKLAEELNDQIKRVEGKKASLVAIDGGVGEGKTTLGIEILDYYNAKAGLQPVSLSKKEHPQLAHGGAQFLEKIAFCHRHGLPCVGYDESGDFNTRGAMSRFNQMLNRGFETFRGFRIKVVLMLPLFKTLDNSLLDKKIVRLLIHCHSRGELYGEYQVYSLYRLYFVKRDMDKFPVPDYAYTKNESNSRGQFLNLPPEREKLLDEISTSYKLKEAEMASIKMEGIVSYSDISKRMGKSVIWAKKIISDLKIKHVRIHKCAKYFPEETINILTDHLNK